MSLSRLECGRRRLVKVPKTAHTVLAQSLVTSLGNQIPCGCTVAALVIH
ncbi:hypothetical protein LINPERPRIM_LOCUS231 [Linum perenne]